MKLIGYEMLRPSKKKKKSCRRLSRLDVQHFRIKITAIQRLCKVGENLWWWKWPFCASFQPKSCTAATTWPSVKRQERPRGSRSRPLSRRSDSYSPILHITSKSGPSTTWAVPQLWATSYRGDRTSPVSPHFHRPKWIILKASILSFTGYEIISYTCCCFFFFPGLRAGKLNVTVQSNTSFTIHWGDDLIQNYVCYSAEWMTTGNKTAHMSFFEDRNNYRSLSHPEGLQIFDW